MKKHNPKVATVESTGMEAEGNNTVVQPGILPSTVGPRITPAIISPTTPGKLILESAQEVRRQAVSITNICSKNKLKESPRGSMKEYVEAEAEAR